MGRILIHPEGFELVSDAGEPIARVDWLDLDRIEAFNIDLICLEFYSAEKMALITEEDLGFEDLAPQLIANLDLEDPDWFNEAIKPRGPNHRILVYDRDAGY